MIVAIVFLTTVGMVLLWFSLASAPQANPSVEQRMRTLTRRAEEPVLPSRLTDKQFEESFNRRILMPFLRQMSGLADRTLPGKSPEIVRLTLDRAGNPGSLGVAEFNGLRLLCLAVFFVGGFVAARTFGTTVPTMLALFGLSLLAGIALPDTLLQQKIAQRHAAIRKSLPDTIDLLIVSVEAGMGFDGAVDKVVEKTRGPLTEEFARALHEIRLGKMRGQALKDMAARMDVPEMTTFVAAIYQADHLGVSIARVLRVQSETIRTARIQRIREVAGKMPVKMLFPLVFFIFPAIFVVLIGPGFVRILKAFG